MVSAQQLKSLPIIEKLQSILRALAILEVVLFDEEDAWLRKFDYQPDWSPGVVFAKFDNGAGDDMFFFFKNGGAIIKGFAHEASISPYGNESKIWPGIYEGVPAELDEELDDAAVVRGDVTFCIWNTGDSWQCGPVKLSEQNDDGADLLNDIFFQPEDYVEWAADDVEMELDLATVSAIYNGESPTDDMIAKLNPDRDANAAQKEIAEIMQ